MHTKLRVIVPVTLVLLTAIACTEISPPKSGAVERARPDESTLTSTLAPASPDPAVARTPEAPVPEIVEVPPEEEERSSDPDLRSLDGLTVQRLVTASDIVHREPVAASSVFRNDEERVYAFVEVSNEAEEDRALLVHFIGPIEQVSGGVEIRIPAAVPRWRTWAYTKHAKEPGLWRVEIRSTDGSLLGALPFEVEPAY